MLTGPIWVTLATCLAGGLVFVFVAAPTMARLSQVTDRRHLRRAQFLQGIAVVALGAAVGWMCQLSILADTTRQAVAYAAAGGLALGAAIIVWPARALARRIQGLRQWERSTNRGGKHV